jgi:hypothetical protein
MVLRSSGVKKSPKMCIGSMADSPTMLWGRVLYALWGLAFGVIGENVGSF